VELLAEAPCSIDMEHFRPLVVDSNSAWLRYRETDCHLGFESQIAAALDEED
jgi:hypothetical protein